MKSSSKRLALILMASVATTAMLGPGSKKASAAGQVTIGVTETIASFNPYADSISMGYAIWCQVYGCLGLYDYEKADYVGMLAERWEIDKNDKNIWTFHLKRGAKRQHDGKELTAEDVVHSVNRINTDPQSKQKQNTSPIKEIVALDNYTVKIVTKEPTASLLEFIFDRVIITGKDLYDKYGARDADRKYPWGWGPYKLKELVIGQRIVLEKDAGHPDVKPENPDTLIFNIMREPEQRVTALLNNEIQIAQFIPPHLAERVKSAPNAELHPASSVEIMFLAMSPKYKPWDNPKLRQALCYAIDRDLIIKNVLKGQADRLDGPIGPGQYGYDRRIRQEEPHHPLRSGEGPRAAQGFGLQQRAGLSRYSGRPLHQRQGGHRGDDPDAQRGRHQRQAADPGVGDVVGRRATGQDAVLLHGPRLGGRSVARAVAILRDRRITADRNIRPADRQDAGRRARDLRPRRPQEGSQHRIQGDRGRGAGVLHVAAPDALRRSQKYRP